MKRLCLTMAIGVMVAMQLLSPMTATAAEAKPLILETSPLPISLSVDPGKSTSTDLRVKQVGGETARLKVTLMKFGAFGEEGKPEIREREPQDDYFDWVKFDKTSFDAPPNVWQTVKMTVNVPKTAGFGYYYAVVFSRVGDDVRRGGRTNSVSGATAVLVLLEARSPNAKRALELTSFSSKHRVYEFLPAEFEVKLENTGNVHGIPHGDIFVMKGKKQLAALSVNASGGNILPASKRIYSVEWTDGFPVYRVATQDGKVQLDKDGRQIKKLFWDWTQITKIRMGKYTAHLFMVYDDGEHDVPIEAQVSFWVIPWRFLLAALVLVALIGFGIYMMVRGTVRGVARGARRISGRR